MEIMVNDKLVALGEVVVVNEKFGVRLTDVISQFGLGDVSDSAWG
jgi:flagellar motor switch protein FliN/FliY